MQNQICMTQIVLIDVDSTINNFQEHFLRLFKEKYPDVSRKLSLHPTHIEVLTLDKDKAMEVLESDGFTNGMVPLEGAVNAIQQIESRGFTVFFCTTLVTDNSNALKDRIHWIGKWFGEKFMNRVIFTKDKSLIRGNFLIDDSPIKTKGILQPEWKLIVFDMSYNQNDQCYGRIFGWTDLDSIFSLLSPK